MWFLAKTEMRGENLQVQFHPPPLEELRQLLHQDDWVRYWSDPTSLFPVVCARILQEVYAPADFPTITLKQVDLRDGRGKGGVSWHFVYLKASRILLDPEATLPRLFDLLDQAIQEQVHGPAPSSDLA